MSSSEHRKLEELFAAAIEQPSLTDRAAFLDQACRDEPHLRTRVEALLRAHTNMGDFLDSPPMDPNATVASPPTDADHTGMIGRYKILQEIGEGGFGTVYMAEQEYPVRRKVALKIIKLGMDTRHVIARFEAERQALALMDHPNIAHVLDAGATDHGRPYFVMELVRGVPITTFCDKHKRTLRERLELFIPVCHAIQHAHQKGIIHRDLKPNNVLVTLDDNQPVPKVIDFGIAKATSQRLTEKTLFTEFRQFLGTPEYMSPDQADGSGLEIDTRTDVYSLGVLLYELLVGVTPFEAKQLREASYGEIQRIIKEVEPPRPSTRLLTFADTEEGRSAAENRQSEPAALKRMIGGDLDWIVMKAMEKDRTRRYATAKDLADDVGRYLRHEPVQARPPSTAYKFSKFVRRNQVAVLAGTIVFAALVGGLSLSTYGLIQANRAREHALEQQQLAENSAREARLEAAEAATANQFLQDMLRAVDPSKALGREVSVRYILDEAAQNIDAGELSDQPEVEASVRMALGETYFALGLYNEAETHLQTAINLRTELLGPEHPSTLLANRALARLLRVTGRFSRAEALLRETAAAQRRVLGEDNPETLATTSELALALWGPGRYAEAEPLHRRVLEIQRRTLGNNHIDTLKSTGYLGAVCRALGEFDEAERLLSRAVEACRRVLGGDHPCTAEALNELGLLREQQGNFAQAEALFQDAYDVNRRVLGVDHPHLAIPMNNLLRVLRAEGKVAAIRPLIIERLKRLRRAAEQPDAGPAALHAYAWELLHCEFADLRNAATALPFAQRAVELDNGRNAGTLETLAVAQHQIGDLDNAIATQRKAIARAMVGGPYNQSDLEDTLNRYLLERGDLVAAAGIPWGSVATRLGESFITGSAPGTALVRRSESLMAAGRYEEAATTLRACLATRQKELPSGNWLIHETEMQLGTALAAMGDFTQAESLLVGGITAMLADPTLPLEHKRAAYRRMIDFCESRGDAEAAGDWRRQFDQTQNLDKR